MDTKHDTAFLAILEQEKNITNLLDAFFGFLHRFTDFYVESTPNQRLGFPPGVAEQILVSIFRKWKKMNKISATQPNQDKVPPATEEVTITAEESSADHVASKDKEKVNTSPKSTKKKTPDAKKSSSKATKGGNPDSYNGASYDNYSWSQSIVEVDVIVPIPAEIRTSKGVRVSLKPDELEVAVPPPPGGEGGTAAEWRSLVKGKLRYKIKNNDSYWCLEPGKHVSLHLEKSLDRWWEALLDTEPDIEWSKIDCTRNLEEMGESEQMKVEELVWNQRRKEFGQPTSDQIRMEKMLKQAWDADGSPFKGTEYDPSVVKFN